MHLGNTSVFESLIQAPPSTQNFLLLIAELSGSSFFSQLLWASSKPWLGLTPTASHQLVKMKIPTVKPWLVVKKQTNKIVRYICTGSGHTILVFEDNKSYNNYFLTNSPIPTLSSGVRSPDASSHSAACKLSEQLKLVKAVISKALSSL